MTYTAGVLPLDAIHADEALQPRLGGLAEAHIRALIDCPESWPAIVVAREGDRLVLLDGFHRLAAAKRRGLEKISVRVVDAPVDGDYLRIAFELNAAHGKPLSLRDRKAYAAHLLQQQPNLADREIGRRTGLNHETIGALRNCASSSYAAAERKPGEIAEDVGLFDPIRFAKATRAQKAVAGYLQRLLQGLEDPYPDEDGVPGLDGWEDDPTAIAQACFITMGPERAFNLLETLDQDARFLLQIAKERQSLTHFVIRGKS